MQEINATMRKFGAPGSSVKAYSCWNALLRPAQVTLGSLVLVAFEPVRAFSALSPASFSELRKVVGDVETTLKKAFACDKINYLMLMMIDPDVHFHVIPRYAGPRNFAGREFSDAGWPGLPELQRPNATDDATNQAIFQHLAAAWPA
jgi:diadenosine tetraphosphate (Ap4A) HIT family hydrolase